MRVLLCGLVVLGAVSLSGCATMRTAPGCTAEGGLTWRELKSDHFLLRTSLDSSAAGRTLIDLEHYRAAILSAWGSKFDPPGRIEVYAVRSKGDLEEFADEKFAGFAQFSAGKPTLVISGQSFVFDGAALPQTVAHELAHYLSRFVLLRQPRWFAEGLAEYLETVELKDDGRVVMGRPNPNIIQWLRANARQPFSNLWQWDRQPDVGAATASFYGTSFLWVHYLLNHYPAQMAQFQGRLARAEEPLQAWRTAFAGMNDEQLTTEIDVYLRQGRYQVMEIPLELSAVAPSERELSPAEVHLARAHLLEMGPREVAPDLRAKQVLGELDLALRHDPAFVPAVAERARATHAPDALTLARQLAASQPEELEALRFLSTSLGGQFSAAKEQIAVLEKAVALSHGTDAELLNGYAWFLAMEGRGAEALPHAQKAVALAPWSAPILDTYAVVLAGNRRCAEAIAVQRRAIEVIPEGAPASERQRYQARIGELSAACKP